jgi:hypothetical protein
MPVTAFRETVIGSTRHEDAEGRACGAGCAQGVQDFKPILAGSDCVEIARVIASADVVNAIDDNDSRPFAFMLLPQTKKRLQKKFPELGLEIAFLNKIIPSFFPDFQDFDAQRAKRRIVSDLVGDGGYE